MDHTDVAQLLSDLSVLHAAGSLTDEELAQAKQQVIESAASMPSDHSGTAPTLEGPGGDVAVPTPRKPLESDALAQAGLVTPDRETTPFAAPSKVPTDSPLYTGLADRADTVQNRAQRASTPDADAKSMRFAASTAPIVLTRSVQSPRRHAGAIVAAIASSLACISFLV